MSLKHSLLPEATNFGTSPATCSSRPPKQRDFRTIGSPALLGNYRSSASSEIQTLLPAHGQDGKALLKKPRVVPKFISANTRKSNRTQPGFLAFCEKSTGAVQFRTELSTDWNCTIERMAGALAVQCLVRGSDPEDFDVLVAAGQPLADQLLRRARELLEQGRAAASPAALSPRQTEILRSVIRNRANKEIASKLNITVRTVKFHVSCLLNRFGVQNRSELAQRAATVLPPSLLSWEDAADSAPMSGPVAVESALHVAKPRPPQFVERSA